MKSDKLLESTQKSLQNKLQEDTNAMELEVNIQELINQGIQKLQDDVDIKCTLIKIEGDIVKLGVEGSKDSIITLKDILNINSESLDEDTVVNRVKNGLYVALQDHFNNVNIKLKKFVQDYDDMVTVRLGVTVADVPYEIGVNFNITDSGTAYVRVSCYGEEPMEKWSYSVHSNDSIVECIKKIQDYFINKNK